MYIGYIGYIDMDMDMGIRAQDQKEQRYKGRDRDMDMDMDKDNKEDLTKDRKSGLRTRNGQRLKWVTGTWT